MTVPIASAIQGCLLGTAVGDALGLPREGLSPQRARRLCGDELRHCLLPGRGMLSDDTEHAAMTAQALARHRVDAEAFSRDLARRLRWWALALPPGVGLATARACLKLLLGFPPHRSGVYSAGNGPMMRAPIIGVCFAGDTHAMRAFCDASTRLTHTDPKAAIAAYAVALCASHALRHPGEQVGAESVLSDLRRSLPPTGAEADAGMAALLDRAADPAPLSADFPHGPGGYCYHTLLAVLHSWLHGPPGLEPALTRVLLLGGDTDTTGAILGGILGGNLGAEAVPARWLDGVKDWPRTVPWLRRVAACLACAASGEPRVQPPRTFWPATVPRNLFLLAVVVGHGLRRLVP